MRLTPDLLSELPYYFGKVIYVPQDKVYAILLSSYSDVLMTTWGAVSAVETVAEPAASLCPIAYGSLGCTELPEDWLDKQWIDDEGKVQHITSVRLDVQQKAMENGTDCEIPCFIMENGHASWYVIEEYK